MPRTPRADAPGALHHVMIRGIERREIFHDDADRWNLVERLARLIPQWGGLCFAWVLMANHVHLLLRTGALPLAWLMHRLNTGFAARFNRRHERVGYLFQNRFKSRLVNDEADLLNNPVRAGLVSDLDALSRFPWSGHGALVGARSAFAFECVGQVLAMFGADRIVARRELREWMALAVDLADPPPGRDTLDVLELRALVPDSLEPEPMSAPGVALPASVDDLVELVCRRFAVPLHELERGARNERAARARAAIAFVAVVRRGIPATRIAARLGVSPQAIGKAVARGERIVREEEPTPRGWR